MIDYLRKPWLQPPGPATPQSGKQLKPGDKVELTYIGSGPISLMAMTHDQIRAHFASSTESI